MMVDFSFKTAEPEDSGKGISNGLLKGKKTCLPRVLDMVKIHIKNELKAFSSKGKLREFVISRPILQ